MDVGRPLARPRGSSRGRASRRRRRPAAPSTWNSSQPVERVGDQEVAHLGPAEVEDVGAPVGVLAAARVGVLVERRCRRSGPAPTRPSGSARAPSRGSRRCRPGAAGRRGSGSSSGVAEPRGRRVVAGDLVAPGPAVRVLHHRQELDVGEAQVAATYVDQLVGQLAVGQALRATSRGAPRRRYIGSGTARSPARVGQPLVVAPLVRRTRRPPTRWPAAPRCGGPAGRPSRARRRRRRGSRTCSACPSPTSGTNSSQTPRAPSERIGCPRPSQPLKSPTTRTPWALGAHTANDVPVTPARRTCARARRAPSTAARGGPRR